MPFWIPISKGGIDFMKQKERFDEKPNRNIRSLCITEKPSSRASPYMNRSGQRAANCGIACCRVWESTEKEILKNVRSSLIFVSQLGKIQTG